MKNGQSKVIWPRLAQALLGLIMMAGAIWVIMYPSSALSTLLGVLGLMLLVRGIAGLIAYYRLKEKPLFKDRLSLALGLLLVILGLMLLIVPHFLAPALQYIAAGAFILMALRGLFALKELKGKKQGLGSLSLILNLVLLVAAILLIFNPLPKFFTLPVLMTASLLCAGADLIISALIKREKQ